MVALVAQHQQQQQPEQIECESELTGSLTGRIYLATDAAGVLCSSSLTVLHTSITSSQYLITHICTACYTLFMELRDWLIVS